MRGARDVRRACSSPRGHPGVPLPSTHGSGGSRDARAREACALMPEPVSVDEYIAGFPPEVQAILSGVREAILSQVPGAEEKIRYSIAAVMLGGRYAIHFAGWKKHVGLYPVPVFDGDLEAEVAPYRAAKDSVNFSYSKPVPYDLIARIAAAIVAKRSAPERE